MRTFERRVQAEEKLDGVYDVCLIEELIPNIKFKKKHKLKSVHIARPEVKMTYRILALTDGLALGRAAMTLKSLTVSA